MITGESGDEDMKNIALRPLALSGMVFFTSSCFLSVNMRGGKVYAAVASALFVAFLFLFALSREKSGKSVRSAAALLAAAMILLGLGLGFLIGTRSARRRRQRQLYRRNKTGSMVVVLQQRLSCRYH